MLAEEAHSPALHEIARRGRQMHREWCQHVFAPALAGLRGDERERREAQLVTLCDVYTWMLLRRQAGLTQRQTERAIFELIKPLTERGQSKWPGSSPTPRPPAGISIH
jgi:hypothetical protein